MQGKRKLERRHLIYYLRVRDRNTDEVIGHLVDITTEGIMLISEKPFEANTLFQLKMDIPSEIFKNKHVTFDAMSIWCKKDINLDFYSTGFRFQKVEPGDIEIIKHLIYEFGFDT